MGGKWKFPDTGFNPRFPFVPRDFDANLYLCEEAFGLLPWDTFGRLSDTLLLHAYVLVLGVTATTALAAALHHLRCAGCRLRRWAVRLGVAGSSRQNRAVLFGLTAPRRVGGFIDGKMT